jgi:hypothetical protein
MPIGKESESLCIRQSNLKISDLDIAIMVIVRFIVILKDYISYKKILTFIPRCGIVQ